MSTNSSSADFEIGLYYEPNKKPLARRATNAPFKQAAALLTIWSVLVINEGAVRFVTTNPSVGSLLNGRPATLVPFLAALFEVVFGFIGLFVGLAAFVLNEHSVRVTKAAMLIQSVLGYYVFAVFVFLLPSFAIADLEKPLMSGLNLSQSRFLLVMSIFTSFHFCLALQGGQFVWMARLVSIASARDVLSAKSRHKTRAMFWNLNLAFAGLWILLTGSVINATVGSGRLQEPFAVAPNIVVLPVLTIVTGIVMLSWGLFGFHLARRERAPSPLYFVVCAAVYVLAFLNFTIVQLGLVDSSAAGVSGADGAAAVHAALIFMVTTMGAYFANLASRERRGLSV
ncbi:hypothetical protein BWQ96_06065 [Gracilariopsis chorda]|uniref:Uncharacterized protein n=1 Tax=Gracilariopsis chorda TaxID=448386 RepID=A0A2V3IQ41_9FLOR|nr:hypothetical protein BWQ96_06065 [Gracilariopsis chorda]|eukprot:PXF44205.1 hypothetical protein BWQ96_06065 [Gracilariopsis chorda]